LLEGIQAFLIFLSLGAFLICGGSEMGMYWFLSPISSGYHHWSNHQLRYANPIVNTPSITNNTISIYLLYSL
jgi:hypothetical protein